MVVFPFVVVVKLGVLVLLTVSFTWPVCPCCTLNVADEARLDVRVKLSVVAVTLKLTVVVAETDPEVPVRVTLVAPAAAVRGTEIVTVVEPLPPLTLVGLKLQEIPL